MTIKISYLCSECGVEISKSVCLPKDKKDYEIVLECKRCHKGVPLVIKGRVEEYNGQLSI